MQVDSEAVLVNPGERVRVKLAAPPEVELIQVEGRMAVTGNELGILDPFGLLDFYAIDPSGGESMYVDRGCRVQAGENWSMDLEQGTYDAYLNGFGHVGRFDVPSSKSVILEQKDSEFTTISVQLPNGLVGEGLAWQTVDTPSGASRLEWSSKSRLSFVVPLGEIEFSPTHRQRGRDKLVWRRVVTKEQTSFVLELPEPGPSVKVALLDHDEPIIEFDYSDVPDLLCGQSYAELVEGVAEFHGLEPGRHKLHIPPIPGYWTPKQRVIDVPESGEMSVEIAIERVE